MKQFMLMIKQFLSIQLKLHKALRINGHQQQQQQQQKQHQIQN